MNYKHAYHAGNFADVVKHILLVQLLNQLGQKNIPFYVLDAYGGRGLYSLSSEEARKTGEAKGGIQAFLKADTEKAPAADAPGSIGHRLACADRLDPRPDGEQEFRHHPRAARCRTHHQLCADASATDRRSRAWSRKRRGSTPRGP